LWGANSLQKKYIVVTGGVLSGIGKGILAASTGRLLKEFGINTLSVKIDPYLNADAGTMNPNQHGEVFVTEDGYEADLDLGHYERFMGSNMRKENNMTAGQVYSSVINKERTGKYLGSTVQIVPHVTGEVKERLDKIEAKVVIVEIGGTVGDIEGEVFLEAIREMVLEKGRENFLFIHITYVPFLKVTNEFKTKPTQQSIQLLRRIGIQPDIIAARSELAIEAPEVRKIALFAGIKPQMVINLPDIKNVYEMPRILYNMKFHTMLLERLRLTAASDFTWEYPTQFKSYKIGIVGKYLGTDDAYKSIIESIFLCGVEKPVLLDSQELEELDDEELSLCLKDYDGLIIPGGFGKRGIEGKLKAIQYARENKKPILGICLGMQLMIIEYARNVLGWASASSSEFDPLTPLPLIDIMEDQKKILQMGGTMRLGAQKTPIFRGTRLAEIYNQQEVVYERHRHRYEVNLELCKPFLKHGEEISIEGNDKYLRISAESEFVECIELENHPFFIGVQYHPEFQTKVGNPHPLFVHFIRAIMKENKGGSM
jgi:CTP synthase